MLCVPAVRPVVVKLAVAVVVEPVTSAEPRVVVPSRKVPVPVGVPVESVTEAVKVTLALRLASRLLLTTVVVVTTGVPSSVKAASAIRL
jgi:hypothetical protein